MSDELSPRERIMASLYRIQQAEEAHRVLCESLLGEVDPETIEGEMAEVGSRPSQEFRFPIEVTGIMAENLLMEWLDEHGRGLRKPGTFVSVRSCRKEYEGKTFFGILLGDLPIGMSLRHDDVTGLLQISLGHGNPAIFVPSLGKIFFGCGSFWGPIKSPDDVREITDDEIKNIWYMKAIREQLGETETETEGDDA